MVVLRNGGGVATKDVSATPSLCSNPGQAWGSIVPVLQRSAGALPRAVAATCWLFAGTQAPGGILSGLLFLAASPYPLIALFHLPLQSPSLSRDAFIKALPATGLIQTGSSEPSETEENCERDLRANKHNKQNNETLGGTWEKQTGFSELAE